jgi:5-bromo-4-chloroindolyl phosphate hydrolysis protein
MDNKEKQVRKTLERHKNGGLLRYESEVLIDVIDSLRKQLTEARKRIEQWEKTFDDIRMLATYPNQD